MENNTLSKSTIGYSLGLVIASLFNALLVILKENVEPVKNWMAALTGHHWATHGLFTIVLFLLLGYLLSKMDLQPKFNGKQVFHGILWSTVISCILIVGFFIYHITIHVH